ncbi:hypothetical protein JNUCC0626_48550 [Lentzea sp. JNUCC 0626]|uniref:hypothetical protein n=1 Tax=Lentzea sp. JNUCC 0626 TaxID=3367513 RepID=UPI0037482E21
MTEHRLDTNTVRATTVNDCTVTVIHDSNDPTKIIYGTVERRGALVGSLHCVDHILQRGWQIVAGYGLLAHNRRTVRLDTVAAAVEVLTTVLTARDSFEVERRLDEYLQRNNPIST